ncbi:MAG: hypothetical protein WCS77_01045 [Elusimicrobiaceae bacterium]
MKAFLIITAALTLGLAAMAGGDVRRRRPVFLLGLSGVFCALVIFAVCGLWPGLAALMFSCGGVTAAFYMAAESSGRKNPFREPIQKFFILLPLLAAGMTVIATNSYIFDQICDYAKTSGTGKAGSALGLFTAFFLLLSAGVIAALFAAQFVTIKNLPFFDKEDQ